jgi:ATP-dependent DNA helicase RecG
MFKEAGFIEKYGSGIKRVINAFVEMNLPKPDFIPLPSGFKVVVYAQPDLETTEATEKVAEATEKTTEKITENQQLIINSIMQNPHVTSEELADIVNIRDDSIRKNLAKLKSRGFIERVGPDKGGYWKINDVVSEVGEKSDKN